MIETEIKIRVRAGAESAVRLLESHGYHVVVPRALQVDQIYDLPDATLRRSGRLLRIRSSRGEAILTYKGPALGGRHKSREELEAVTDQGSVLAEILDRLGYLRAFRYEKYRTTFEDEKGVENALIALDETPIGVFLELEGPGDWIDRTAHRLGFGAGEYITASYASLYRDYLNFHDGPADMVFRDEQNVDSGIQPQEKRP